MTTLNQYQLLNDFRMRAPVDVEGLARALGVEVNYAPLASKISGMLEKRSNDRYLITVNETDPETRQRFTIAHELGHYMLHQDLIGDGIDDDRAYRSTDEGKYFNTYIGKQHETEANQFAANLLMPKALIDGLKLQGLTDCNDLARKLNVSKQAMCIRLGIPFE